MRPSEVFQRTERWPVLQRLPERHQAGMHQSTLRAGGLRLRLGEQQQLRVSMTSHGGQVERPILTGRQEVGSMNAALIVLVCVCTQTPPTSDIPKDQFLALIRQEAVPKWSAYTAMTEACEITFRFESHRLKPNGDILPGHPNDKVLEGTYVLLKNYGSRREVTDLVNRKDSKVYRIDCYNTRYSFELQGQVADKMALRNIYSPLPPNDTVSDVIRGVGFHRNGWIFRGKTFHDLWADSNCTFGSVRKNAGGNYLISFTRALGKDTKVICPYEVELNPNQGWRIEAATSHVPGRVETTETMSYDKEGFPVPIPSQCVYSETDLKTAERIRSLITVTHFQSEPQREEAEFTLSAFGMPEPVGVVWDKPTPRYVWFLVAAGVFIAIAVGFRLLARRRAARLAT